MDFQMVINGEKVGAELEKIEVINPGTNEIVGTVPNGGEQEAKVAIESAHQAFHSWSKTTAYERAKLLHELNNIMLAETNDLAETMTLEMGKPLQQSIGEVSYSASFIEWYAEEGKRVYGETVPSDRKSVV